MNDFVIIAGSPIDDVAHIKPYIKPSSKIICADGGAIHADKLGITPDILVGDFDSIPQDLLKQYQADDNIDVIASSDQNSTDLEKALRLIPNKATNIDIFGALGGRMDHVFANILTLEKHSAPDRFCIHDADQQIRLLTKDHTFTGKIGDKIGILPLRDIKELSYDGLLYQTDALSGPYTLGWLGSSNEMSKEKAAIYMNGGLALFTHYKI